MQTGSPTNPTAAPPAGNPRSGSYGSWSSPITGEIVAAQTVPLSEPKLDGATLYWIELRKTGRARYVLVSRPAGGRIADITPDGYSVLSLVHSYGGGAYEVRDGTAYFVSADDQQIYTPDCRTQPAAAPSGSPRGIRANTRTSSQIRRASG